jgi:hypothetical protein
LCRERERRLTGATPQLSPVAAPLPPPSIIRHSLLVQAINLGVQVIHSVVQLLLQGNVLLHSGRSQLSWGTLFGLAKEVQAKRHFWMGSRRWLLGREGRGC